MQYFATLVIILIFVFTLWIATNSEHRLKIKKLFRKSSKPKVVTPNFTTEKCEVTGANGTMIYPDLTIHQLSVDKHGNTTTIKTFPVRIKTMRESGYFISGCSHQDGDAILMKCPEAELVSKHHLGIGYDEQGFFAVDNGSSNKTYLLSENGTDIKEVKQFDIKNGTTVCLGPKQWIRFTLNDVGRFIPSFNNNAPNRPPSEPKTKLYERKSSSEKPTRLTRC